MADRIVIMRDGWVEQIGAPAEVYQRPVSRFVADFQVFCDPTGSLASEHKPRRAAKILEGSNESLFSLQQDCHDGVYATNDNRVFKPEDTIYRKILPRRGAHKNALRPIYNSRRLLSWHRGLFGRRQ